jgi:membrane peptidoglycan carboxypeptidase
MRLPWRAERKEKPANVIMKGFRTLQQYVMMFWAWVKRQHTELGPKKFWIRTFLIFCGLVVLYILWLIITLPNIDDPRSLRASQSTTIVDRNGTELYRLFSDEDRTYVEGAQISPYIKEAIVAIEDQRFYTRGCLDVRALARAVLHIGGSGGASTLTRQLARNALSLKQENILSRKLKELILGCSLEHKYSKEQLLELYLNWIPFGQNAYGIEQASKRFFAASASGLTLAQASVLASLPQLPTYYSPYGSHVHTQVTSDIAVQIREGKITTASEIPDDDVRIGLLGVTVGSGSSAVYIGGRTDQVLQNMVDQKFITEDERAAALKELRTIKFKPARESIRAPHFVLWIKDQVEKLLQQEDNVGLLEQGGLVIETTLDWNLQQAAEKAVADHKDSTLKLYGAHNIALMSVDPHTREILSYVGNADYRDEEHGGKIDMVQVPRQPGSSFKPFVYAASFLQGYGPATPLYDVPTKFGTDTPSNFEGNFWGLMNVRSSLAGSRNIPAIKAFFLAGGEEPVLDLAAKFGIETPRISRDAAVAKNPDFGYGWPLSIGAAETPLAEMVNGYATFADDGTSGPLVSIKKITTAKGVLLYEADEPEKHATSAVDPRIAYEITSILSDTSARPDAFWQQALNIPGYEVAAKTGTSNKCLDRNEKTNVCNDRRPESLWTMGYSPDLVAGVWVGNATSDALSPKADGLNVAAPIWKQYMMSALKLLPNAATTFAVPDGISELQISSLSGQLPTDCTPVAARRGDVFLSENTPNVDDPACVKLLVDKVTGLLASDKCPADAAEERSFLLPKSELPDRWPLWEQGVQAWAEGMRKRAVGTGGMLTGSGTRLLLPIAPTKECDASLTPERLVKPTLELTSPSNGGTVSYPSFQPRVSVTSASGLKEISFTVDGKLLGKATNLQSLPILRMPSSISESGEHTLEVTMMDGYYNTATAKATFRFGEDTGAPTVELRSLTDGTTFKTSDSIAFSATASDAEGPVKYVEFYLDDVLLTRKPKEPYMIEYPLKGVSPGEHTVRAVATDLSDHEAQDAVTITVQ